MMLHNKKIKFFTSILTLSILLNGCSIIKTGFSISGIKEIITSDDGYPLITYELKMEPDIFKGKPPKAMLFYIQGSEYTTVLSKVGVLAGAVTMGSSVVLVERRGIIEDGKIDMDLCYKYSEKQIRIKDHLRVIDEYLKKIDSNIPVILMGGSEGGDIAAVVASRENRITHLILLGSGGGWTQAEEFGFFVSTKKKYLNVHDIDKLNSIFDDIKANPDSLKMWAGHPYRRWNSFLWDRSSDYLINFDIPIFVAHGDKDESVPVESARAVKEKFDKLGKTNLTYKEYKNTSHSFVNLKDGILMLPLIEVDLLEWLEETQVISKNEKVVFEERVKKAHPEFFKK